MIKKTRKERADRRSRRIAEREKQFADAMDAESKQALKRYQQRLRDIAAGRDQ